LKEQALFCPEAFFSLSAGIYMRLVFDRGTLVLFGDLADAGNLPGVLWDPRIRRQEPHGRISSYRHVEAIPGGAPLRHGGVPIPLSATAQRNAALLMICFYGIKIPGLSFSRRITTLPTR